MITFGVHYHYWCWPLDTKSNSPTKSWHGSDIPDNCHFVYTCRVVKSQILHPKIPNNYPKRNRICNFWRSIWKILHPTIFKTNIRYGVRASPPPLFGESTWPENVIFLVQKETIKKKTHQDKNESNSTQHNATLTHQHDWLRLYNIKSQHSAVKYWQLKLVRASVKYWQLTGKFGGRQQVASWGVSHLSVAFQPSTRLLLAPFQFHSSPSLPF